MRLAIPHAFAAGAAALLWTAYIQAAAASIPAVVAEDKGQTVFGVHVQESDMISDKGPRPLVIWHGLGDTALSDGISGFIEDIKDIYPAIFVHSVQVPINGSLDDERRAGFWGNAEEQGRQGCEQLASISELEGGFDAIGFSQGGLFMRYYVQYCNDPPVRNLVTFGTPHFGIAALIPCPTPPTLSCLLAARAARSGIYKPWTQRNLVQAAYFRDTERLDEFWEVNEFVRDLNGEKGKGQSAGVSDGDDDKKWKGKNGAGKGLGGLETFVAIQFADDRTVSPAQSSHFGTYIPGSKDKETIIPITDQPIYNQTDEIGLRKLNKAGRLKLLFCPGAHMEIGGEDGCGLRMVRDWIGWGRERERDDTS
ncbi:palmitoyl-protein thioesterase [Kwoniella heveanensis CBS 569]|nr:palmitoyl-protein thioesterase [Kwoniella heveanensis CBS 569]